MFSSSLAYVVCCTLYICCEYYLVREVWPISYEALQLPPLGTDTGNENLSTFVKLISE